MRSHIRMLKNVILVVDRDGTQMDVLFKFGDIIATTKIEQAKDGFANVYLTSGDILRGVDAAIFSNLRTPVTEVETIEPAEFTEIVQEQSQDKPISLTGEVVSESPRPKSASIEDIMQLVQTNE